MRQFIGILCSKEGNTVSFCLLPEAEKQTYCQFIIGNGDSISFIPIFLFILFQTH